MGQERLGRRVQPQPQNEPTEQQIKIQEMNSQQASVLPSEGIVKKKKNLKNSLMKIVKNQEREKKEKDYAPGQLNIVPTEHCKPKMMDFFGDFSTQCFSLKASPDVTMMAAGCSNGDVRVYDLASGKLFMMGNSSRLGGFPNTGLQWNPLFKDQLAVCNCDGTIKWYKTSQEAVIAHHESETGYLCAEYNNDGSFCAFGTETNDIELYDSQTKKLLQKYQGGKIYSSHPNHTNRVFCLKRMEENPNMFFSGGWDATVRIWDARVKDTYIRKFIGPSVTADSLDLRGNVLLAGNYSNDQPVEMWDFGKGELIEKVDIKEERNGSYYCYGACFAKKSPMNIFGAIFSGINKVKIFRDSTIVSEMTLQDIPLCLNFYQSDGRAFCAVSGNEGIIYIVKLKISSVS